jgi:hypothetical protein
MGEVTDGSKYFDAIGLFQQARAQLNSLEDEMRQDSSFAAQYGAQITAAEAYYQDLRDKFTTLYRAVYGTVPAGLAAFPVIAVVTIVAVLTGLAALLYYLKPLMDALLAAQQTRLVQEQTQQTATQSAQEQAAALNAAAAAADAAGDTERADALRAQTVALIKAIQGGTTTTTDYASLLLIGAGGVVLYLVLR